MASLTGQTIASTYDALLKISDNGPINGTLKQITDGLGNNTPLYLSGNTVSIDGSFKLTGRLFDKNNESGVAGQFLVSSGDGVDWQNISESGLITGLGTASFLSKFTAGGVIADSIVSESASGIGIGITATQKLHVLGNGLFTGTLNSSNLSGNNTGDETKVSIETKLGAATSSNDGYLTSTNWSTFNAKQPALNGLGFVKIDGTTISYDNSTYALASRNIATTSPLSGGGDLSANRSLSIAKSDSLTDGYLSADDFVNFNSKVPSARTITINGETFDLSANRTYAVNVGVTSFNTRVGAVSLSSLDVTNALGYTPAIDSRIMTINGVGYSLAADRTWNVGTVTSVGTSAPLTGGTITGSGTIGISQSNTTTDGYLSATDWNTFNNKQANLGYTPENLANKGINNGYASLGGDGKVPSTQLPSYVDDVVEVANFAALPATGETGKIYVTLDNDFVYRWSGSIYVRISSPNAIWGSITGTLSNQIDLQNALNAKVSSVGLDLGTSGTDVNVANSPITSSGNITLNLPTASATNRGLLSSANWTTFNNKQNALTLTTTGTSGASTLVGSTLNIPQYQPQLSGTGFVKISGTTISYDNNTYLTTSSAASTYLPLAGGTLTGPLNGTSATFSTNVGIGSQTGLLSTNGIKLGIDYGNIEFIGSTFGSGYGLKIYQNGERSLAIAGRAGSTTWTNHLTILDTGSATFSNDVSIGYTTNPSLYKLDVNGSGRFSGSLLVASGAAGNATTISNNGDFVSNWIGNSTTQLLSIRNNSTAGVYINTQNSVPLFLGVSSSTTGGTTVNHLTIASTGAATFSSSALISSNLQTNGVLTVGNQNSAGNYFLQITPSTTTPVSLQGILAGVGISNIILQAEGGNVGIGTTTPGSILNVSSSNPIFTLTRNDNGTTAAGAINFSATSNVKWQIGSSQTVGNGFEFNFAGSNLMYLTQGGNVLIGTTTDNGAKLQVNGASGLLATFSSSLDECKIGLLNTKTGGKNWYLNSYSNGNLYLQIDSANLGIFDGTTGVYTALSDVNKKKDFEQSQIGLNAILGLKPTLYRMKTDANNSDKHLGFIAQEVKEFIPQAYSESGEGENKFIGLTEMPIIATLVKAIQEQQAQIEELKLLILNK